MGGALVLKLASLLTATLVAVAALGLLTGPAGGASLRQPTGPHTCNLPLGMKGVLATFERSGRSYATAINIEKANPYVDQSAPIKWSAAFVGKQNGGALLLVLGWGRGWCGEIGCPIEAYIFDGRSWNDAFSLDSDVFFDNLYLYHPEHAFPYLSTQPSLTDESWVFRFNPTTGKYEPCDSDIRVFVTQKDGSFVVPVTINESVRIDFTIDSGASDVLVPLDVFETLIRSGTITNADIRGQKTYVMADGSERTLPTFVISTLKIGSITLHSVQGTVGPQAGSPLLGQSVLSKFQSWSIDNSSHELVISPASGSNLNSLQ